MVQKSQSYVRDFYSTTIPLHKCVMESVFKVLRMIARLKHIDKCNGREGRRASRYLPTVAVVGLRMVYDARYRVNRAFC